MQKLCEAESACEQHMLLIESLEEDRLQQIERF
jgi:hypothetical protein